MPEIPTSAEHGDFIIPASATSESWQVSGFENYVVFYRGIPDGIEVLHVYHGARDIDSLFETD